MVRVLAGSPYSFERPSFHREPLPDLMPWITVAVASNAWNITLLIIA
jgi:hypothetical protein